MNPGDMVTCRWAGYTPMYQEIHGVFVAPFHNDEIGIVIDFRYSNTDVPYIQILTSSGMKGWLRYERVEVI